jgi:biopolymer transport protein ExbD
MPVKLKRDQALLSLSLTPLIDVVFQLLLFFIVATRFADEDRELIVPLPDASEARPITYVPQELFININQDGQFFVGGRVVDETELEDILQRAATNNPANQSVRIHADKRTAFQSVVTAVNLCKRAGIRDYIADIAADNTGS